MEERVFELEEDPKIKIKYQGKEYEMRYPSPVELAQMVRIEKQMQDGKDISDGFEAINKHLSDLGMPKNVVSKLSHKQVANLLNFVYDKDQKKS